MERPDQPGAFAVRYATSEGSLAAAVTVSWPRAAVAARRAIPAGTPLETVHAAITATPPPATTPPGLILRRTRDADGRL